LAIFSEFLMRKNILSRKNVRRVFNSWGNLLMMFSSISMILKIICC